jgi:hypothetical protein
MQRIHNTDVKTDKFVIDNLIFCGDSLPGLLNFDIRQLQSYFSTTSNLANTLPLYPLYNRVSGFLSSRLYWVPLPLTSKRVLLPPPLDPRGGDTRLRVWEWRDPIPTRGKTFWYLPVHSKYTIIPLRFIPFSSFIIFQSFFRFDSSPSLFYPNFTLYPFALLLFSPSDVFLLFRFLFLFSTSYIILLKDLSYLILK